MDIKKLKEMMEMDDAVETIKQSKNPNIVSAMSTITSIIESKDLNGREEAMLASTLMALADSDSDIGKIRDIINVINSVAKVLSTSNDEEAKRVAPALNLAVAHYMTWRLGRSIGVLKSNKFDADAEEEAKDIHKKMQAIVDAKKVEAAKVRPTTIDAFSKKEDMN